MDEKDTKRKTKLFIIWVLAGLVVVIVGAMMLLQWGGDAGVKQATITGLASALGAVLIALSTVVKHYFDDKKN